MIENGSLPPPPSFILATVEVKYETFMASPGIKVRAFTKQKDAAEWLEVPIEFFRSFRNPSS